MVAELEAQLGVAAAVVGLSVVALAAVVFIISVLERKYLKCE